MGERWGKIYPEEEHQVRKNRCVERVRGRDAREGPGPGAGLGVGRGGGRAAVAVPAPAAAESQAVASG